MTQGNVHEAAEYLESQISNTSSIDDEALESIADLLDDIVDTLDVSPNVSTQYSIVLT